MDKKQISILVPERLVMLADETGKNWGQSRAFAMTRWMLEAVGMEVEEALEYFPRGLGQAVDSEKKSDISATSGEGAEFGRGKNPKRVGRIPEEMVEQSVESPWTTMGVVGQHVEKVVDMNGRVWTREEVEAAGFGELQPPVGVSGSPGPGFVPAGDNSDFPGMDVAAGLVPDPVSGPVYPLMPLPPAIAAEAERIMKAADKIITPKSKKIASVPASVAPTPGKSQEKKNVQTQPRQPQAGQSRREDPTPQTQSPQAESESQPPAGTGQRLDGHDPKTCKLYGCLMCKAAKEEK